MQLPRRARAGPSHDLRGVAVANSDPVERLTVRLQRLEDRTDELDDRLAAERAARQLLQRDVRWILRVSMGAAAVVSFLISVGAQYLASYF